ncbi:MAG: dihydroorotate dehydrogenase electron transfer subunit [Oscillospiraceae bacterium]|nr:dihydroorotate dehydrogenase electron transfer subunit [Oscillospiraceae bacterium]
MGDAVYMVLEAGDMVRTSFKGPGQFVHIKCGDAQLLRRPISVCLCSEDEPDDLVSIVFEVRGEGTAWLAERQVGDELDVLGLAGNGFQLEQDKRCLLVGGGIGIPPMLGCAAYFDRSTAILGGRSKDKIILTDRFEVCSDKVMIATDDGSLGHHGFVDALVRQELEQDRAYDCVLACGPKPMLRNVAKVAAEFGVQCFVSMEERMGCGIGACLVCACDMTDGSRRHVCKNGPVFDAEEVDWNA